MNLDEGIRYNLLAKKQLRLCLNHDINERKAGVFVLRNIAQTSKVSIKERLKKYKKAAKLYRRIRQIPSWIYYMYQHKKNLLISQKYSNEKLQNKIVFNNFQGRGYGCNPKYIAEEILRRGYDWDLVWLVNNMDLEMPQHIRKVEFYGKESYYELATAKVIINNVKGDLNFKKRPEQLYIQTWHAPYSPKLLEKDASDNLPLDYLQESKDNSKITDVFLSNSIAQSEEYLRAFWCDCFILEAGLPRCDLFFKKNKDELCKQIRKKLDISDETRILMYAPTFRGEKKSFEDYGVDIKKVLCAIKNKFGGEWTVLLRLHPNIKVSSNNKNEIGRDVSWYSDMQELLLIADVLITDYSSLVFEFAEMYKPVFLYADDIDYYQQVRGLKPIFFDLPCKVCQNNDELQEAILSFDLEEYCERFKAINAEFSTFDCGNASENVVDYIFDWMNKQVK